MKALFAMLGLLSLGAAEPTTVASPFIANFAIVPRITCDKVIGSGVRISDTVVITAAHVTNERAPCSIGGTPMTQIRVEPNRDVAFIEGNMTGGFRAIYSCDGIREGARYLVMGYAFGTFPNVEPMIGIGDMNSRGQALLKGRNYHGMSGGGIFEEGTGRLVAVNNALASDVNYTWVTPLSETYLCKGTGHA